MTAVDYLIEQLQAPCRGIPSHIIEQARLLEKQQQDELEHIRRAKDHHTKNNNPMIVVLYREIERLLEKK